MKPLKKEILYLASKSARRREILKSLRIPFRVVASGYRERMDSRLSARELVLRHAEGKARRAVVSKRVRFVLGADTIVWCQGRALGKPKTYREAFRMLSRLSGRWHEVYTGVAFWDRARNRMRLVSVKTRVLFSKLSAEAIRQYMQKVYPLDKAGAYAIQESPKAVRRIQGSYTNVVGLPAEWVGRVWKKFRQPV